MNLSITLGLKTGAGETVPVLLIELLKLVDARGSLAAAAEQQGVSYRTAWNLINNWSGRFSVSLLDSEKGRGARLTGFGQALLWAAQQPELEMKAACRKVEKQINLALAPHLAVDASTEISMHASDCLSHEIFLNLFKAENGEEITILNCGSTAALIALSNGECQMAGFHIANGKLSQSFIDTYRQHINPARIRLLKVVSRKQGLIIHTDNPLGITNISDLVKTGARLANRQSGAGTRLLLDALLQKSGVDSRQVVGYEDVEMTHSEVCARIAGKTADVALGTQASAYRYGLQFIPLVEESYYFAFNRQHTDHEPDLEGLFLAVQGILAGAPWKTAMAALDGYSAADSANEFDGSRVF